VIVSRTLLAIAVLQDLRLVAFLLGLLVIELHFVVGGSLLKEETNGNRF